MVLGPMGICYLAFRVVAITCCYRRHRYTLGTNHWRHCRRDHAQRGARYSRGAGHNADRRCLGTLKTKIPDAKCRVKHARRRPVRSKRRRFFRTAPSILPAGVRLAGRRPRSARAQRCTRRVRLRRVLSRARSFGCSTTRCSAFSANGGSAARATWFSPASCCRGEPPAA